MSPQIISLTCEIPKAGGWALHKLDRFFFSLLYSFFSPQPFIEPDTMREGNDAIEQMRMGTTTTTTTPLLMPPCVFLFFRHSIDSTSALGSLGGYAYGALGSFTETRRILLSYNGIVGVLGSYCVIWSISFTHSPLGRQSTSHQLVGGTSLLSYCWLFHWHVSDYRRQGTYPP